LVPESLTFKPKSTISSNPIELWDKGVQQYDSKMIFQDWTLEGDKCQNRIFQNHIQLLGYNRIKVNGEFLRTSDPL